MSEVWDTTTAARLRPDSAALEYAQERYEGADPIALTASTFNEISYGLNKVVNARGPAMRAQLRWLLDQIAVGLVVVLPFEHRAANVAGAVRAKLPAPPVARRARERSKAENRVAWILDIQTAATAFVHGYELVSADAHHPLIAAQLALLAPAGSPLRVRVPPTL